MVKECKNCKDTLFGIPLAYPVDFDFCPKCGTKLTEANLEEAIKEAESNYA